MIMFGDMTMTQMFDKYFGDNAFKERCGNCACLVEENGDWMCDEIGRFCREIADCPEGMKGE